jgi:hypothetical protein
MLGDVAGLATIEAGRGLAKKAILGSGGASAASYTPATISTPYTSPDISTPTLGSGGGGGGGGSNSYIQTVVINAGIMFTPDRNTLEAAIRQFWSESQIMANAGQIPRWATA